MKTFKNILSEVAQPKSSEEKAFKDLHNQKPGQHPVAPDNQFSGDIGKPKAVRKADNTPEKADAEYDTAYGDKPDQEPVLRKGRKFSQFRANESKEMSNMKALDKASETTPEGKKKVSLAKAPWEKDKNEEFVETKESLLGEERESYYSSKKHAYKPKRKEYDPDKVATQAHLQHAHDFHDVETDKGYDRYQTSRVTVPHHKAQVGHLHKAMKANATGDKAALKKHMHDYHHGNENHTINKTATYPHSHHLPHHGDRKAADRLVGENTDLSDKVSDVAFGKWNEALSGGQKKLDHNKNGKIDGHDFAIMRAKGKKKTEVDETTSSAMKRMVTQTGPDGKTRTVMKKLRSDRTDDRGQDIIVGEELEEAVKMGNLRLKNGKNVKVSNQDAKLLNSFYKNLNAKNRRDMEKVMMKDEAGFKEIVGFAREAL